MKNLGEFITRIRYRRGLSQRKLATRAGISNSTVHRIEKGIIKNVKPQVLRKLSDALSLPYQELLYYAGYLNEKEANFEESEKQLKL
ncbi:MAG: hypothetical protein CVU88_01720 [Firmicutes bacterium HGW-Firmicutes-13]|nr:MAG: hypothetical protein CVU88_01720 [Firmicutes bacterium HGW-Firmicutes-13]